MAIRTKRLTNGLLLKPCSAGSISSLDKLKNGNLINGLIFIDQSDQRLKIQIENQERQILTTSQSQVVTNKTISTNDNTIQVSASGVVATELDAALEELKSIISNTGGAPTNSPTFTGIPTAPTAPTGTNTTQIATTQFVVSELQNAFEPGDVLLSYVDKTNFSKCDGKYIYSESNFEINNILPLNSDSIQTINNPYPITNGFFSPEFWISNTALITNTRSNNPSPFYQRYVQYQYNIETKLFSNPIQINSNWGLSEISGISDEISNKVDNNILFCTSVNGTNTTQVYFKIVKIDENGNYLSTEVINSGFTVTSGSSTPSVNTNVISSLYKYNNNLYICAYKRNGDFQVVEGPIFFKKNQTTWTQFNVSINIPSNIINNTLRISSFNSYILVTGFDNSINLYRAYVAKFITEDTATLLSLIEESSSSFSLLTTSEDYIDFTGILIRGKFQNNTSSLLSLKLDNNTYIKNYLTFNEFVEPNLPSLSIGIESLCIYSSIQDLNYSYNINLTNEILLMVYYTNSKKVSAFKITINLDGTMTKQLIETHTLIYSFGGILSKNKGVIDLDGNFSSFSGRFFVIPSKIKLPTLISPATDLNYYIKIKK